MQTVLRNVVTAPRNTFFCVNRFLRQLCFAQKLSNSCGGCTNSNLEGQNESRPCPEHTPNTPRIHPEWFSGSRLSGTYGTARRNLVGKCGRRNLFQGPISFLPQPCQQPATSEPEINALIYKNSWGAFSMGKVFS